MLNNFIAPVLRTHMLMNQLSNCVSWWCLNRHGRAELDAQLEAVFGTSDLNSGKTLGLTEFLSSLHANQVGVCDTVCALL
jgi:hypothetical protein